MGRDWRTRVVTGEGGVPLAVHWLGGDGSPLLLAHATGFHGRCFVPLAAPLTDRFTVWGLDQRGHGESGKAGRYDDWGVFANDLLRVVDAIGGEGWRAGGHSLGGGVSLLAEARRPGTFKAIAAYEPVVVPPGGFPADPGSGPHPGLADLARKRRPWFESKEAALANYRSKPPFSSFDPTALEAYVEYGLVDAPGGGVTLACRREDEAAVFDGAPRSPTWDALPSVRAPVAVFAGRAEGADPIGRIAGLVARRLARGGLRRFDTLDHFGPLTAPAEVGEAMAAAFRAASP